MIQGSLGFYVLDTVAFLRTIVTKREKIEFGFERELGIMILQNRKTKAMNHTHDLIEK